MTFDFTNSTIMSVLFGVAQHDQAQRRQQLERFALQYTQPLVTFLCRTKRIEPEQAEEIVQDFWLAKLVLPSPDQTIAAKYLVKVRETAATSPGSFRRYLMRSIGYHFLDRMRRNKNAPASLDGMEGFDVVSEQDCQAFDAAWANSILRTCINEVHQECIANDQIPMWQLFCSQIVLPKLWGTPPPGYATLATKFEFSDARTAANAVRTVIRKFQSHLNARVLDYLPVEPSEKSNRSIEQECSAILALLSKPGALDSKLFEDVVRHVAPDERRGPESSFMGISVDERPFLTDPSQSLYSTDADFHFRWQQLLITPICKWLASHAESCDATLPTTFRDMARGQTLSTELLLSIRNTAKRLAREEQDEPQVILATLYLASIANGQRNHNTLLTADPPAKILRRIDQILQHSWLDSDTRQLLSRFQSSLLE